MFAENKRRVNCMSIILETYTCDLKVKRENIQVCFNKFCSSKILSMHVKNVEYVANMHICTCNLGTNNYILALVLFYKLKLSVEGIYQKEQQKNM